MQLSQELTLNKKLELIDHLYHKLCVRSLTISGGEPLRIGDNDGKDFISLMKHLKQYKTSDPINNLVIKLYSNGILLSDEIASSMQGIVDSVSINIDSYNDTILKSIGRTNSRIGSFFEKAISAMQLLYKYHIKVKLHTVVSALNYNYLSHDVQSILDEAQKANPLIDKWKFYQYMSYDDPRKDELHRISNEMFKSLSSEISQKLGNHSIKLWFKSNEEMSESLFNILATGIAQYCKEGDTWKTTPRTRNLLEYESIDDLLSQNNINKELFEKYHLYKIS